MQQLLVISRGVELAGRVFVEDGRPVQAGTPAGGQEQLDMSQLRVSLEPKEHAPMLGGLSPAQLKSDGTFRLENVAWERYSLNVVGLQGDYYLKAARLGGTDVLEQGLSLSGAAPPGWLELWLSPTGASIEGTVVDAQGQPVAGATVLLAPEPRSRHRTNLFKTTAADQRGRFTFRGITPLEYTLLAWEEVEPGVYQDPNFLRLYERQGRVVRLQPADRIAVQLLAIPADDVLW